MMQQIFIKAKELSKINSLKKKKKSSSIYQTGMNKKEISYF